MYHIGQHVTHPMHGAGTICEQVERRADGQVKQYFVLKLVRGGLQLFVPCDGCEKIGLRPIMTMQEADGFLQELSALQPENTGNWNQRYKENIERLRSGQPLQVAVVIKSLHLREKMKHLSTGERKMLNTAWQVLTSELALAKVCAVDEAEELLRAALK